ncbi:MAG: Trk family potassium uptake protein [Lachnospiraceae bacterium]|nr:Trk family potassium uptake protein [Lachnospiraceae bacterium]
MAYAVRKRRLSSFQIIILGFVGIIVLGAVLLMLPISSASRSATSAEDSFFTATSAVCVTGLVVQDTATHWSRFGQVIILMLIQIGGLGVVSIATFIASLSGRKISLFQRSMLQDSISAHQIGGVVKMTGFIFRMVFAIEAIGAVLLLPSFCSRFGWEGVWMAVFHSISAFCNAGFDIMGGHSGEFSSLTSLYGTIGVVLPICILIVVGGIGFLTWDDIATHKHHFKRYRMQTKMILITTLLLIVVPAAIMFFMDFAEYPFKERVCLSLFQSITPRTAGFNTADMNLMTDVGRILIITLMLIGGSPGSTAGGMKTTTLAVLCVNMGAIFRRKKATQAFGRRIDDGVVKTAGTLLMMYLILAFGAGMFISAYEGLPIGKCLFETASAIGTAGLSLGITSSLGLASHLILIVLMFLGRVGGLTLMYAALSDSGAEVSRYPVERIVVG